MIADMVILFPSRIGRNRFCNYWVVYVFGDIRSVGADLLNICDIQSVLHCKLIEHILVLKVSNSAILTSVVKNEIIFQLIVVGIKKPYRNIIAWYYNRFWRLSFKGIANKVICITVAINFFAIANVSAR